MIVRTYPVTGLSWMIAGLLAAPGLDMAVDRVVARVEHPPLNQREKGGLESSSTVSQRLIQEMSSAASPQNPRGRTAIARRIVSKKFEVSRPMDHLLPAGHRISAHEPVLLAVDGAVEDLRGLEQLEPAVAGDLERPGSIRGPLVGASSGVKSRTILRFWSRTFSESIPETRVEIGSERT